MLTYLPKDWSREDILFLLGKVEAGQFVLIADSSLGLPTIHDRFEVEPVHCGMGLFKVKTDHYTLHFDAGGAMQRTPGGNGWSQLELSSGTYSFDLAGLRAKLVDLLALPPEPVDVAETPPTGSIPQVPLPAPSEPVSVRPAAPAEPIPPTQPAAPIEAESASEEEVEAEEESSAEAVPTDVEEPQTAGMPTGNAAVSPSRPASGKVENVLKTFPFDLQRMPLFVNMALLPPAQEGQALLDREVLLILDDRRDEIDHEPAARFACRLGELQQKLIEALTQYGQQAAVRQERLAQKEKAVESKRASEAAERKKKEAERQARSKSAKAAAKPNARPTQVDLNQPAAPVIFPAAAAPGPTQPVPAVVSQQMNLF